MDLKSGRLCHAGVRVPADTAPRMRHVGTTGEVASTSDPTARAALDPMVVGERRLLVGGERHREVEKARAISMGCSRVLWDHCGGRR